MGGGAVRTELQRRTTMFTSSATTHITGMSAIVNLGSAPIVSSWFRRHRGLDRYFAGVNSRFGVAAPYRALCAA